MPQIDDGSNVVDLINITVGDTYRVKADGAKLHVQVRGSSLMSAKMAFTKAKEVAALVGQLQTAGLSLEDIEIEGVHVEVASGSIMKTSEASYTLCATCASLDLLPSILSVISTQKQATLHRVEWVYSDEDFQRDEWLEALIEKAKAKALTVSKALGVRIVALHTFTENTHSPVDAIRVDLGHVRSMQSKNVDLGIDINHSKEISLQVDVQYRVSSIQ
jgi:uncharacterized protein YggE